MLGMGGSGIAGDVLAAVAGPFMPVPVTVVKGYDAPSSVGDGTLCFAISYSGDTEETVEAAQAAAAPGARMVVLSTGGTLGELARAWGAPHIVLPDCPMPRAGIGSVSIPPLVVLERVGLFPGATAVRRRRGRPAQAPPRQADRRRRPGPAPRPPTSVAPCPWSTAAMPSAGWRPTASSARSTRTPRRRPSAPRCPRWATTRSAAGASTATSPAR